MHITFIEHSGFLVELDRVLLLFDWYKGALPELPEGKPLIVFASHRHQDHFNPMIFRLDDGRREIRFMLGFDIRLNPKHIAAWNLSAETVSKCVSAKARRTYEPLEGVYAECLLSTDEGVAFLIRTDGQVIYHAGDLNWWHWNGDPDAENIKREQRFKKYSRPLFGEHIDVAMVPVDPRQGAAGYRAAEYLLETSDIDTLIPMHQWNDFDFTDGLIEAAPEYASRIRKVTHNGQTFDI